MRSLTYPKIIRFRPPQAEILRIEVSAIFPRVSNSVMVTVVRIVAVNTLDIAYVVLLSGN